MDKKLVAIVVMTVTAVALMIANFVAQPSPAHAESAVGGFGYQVATARMTSGGEGVYILDGRSGLMAIFSYDAGTKQMRPRAIRKVSDFFGGASAGK